MSSQLQQCQQALERLTQRLGPAPTLEADAQAVQQGRADLALLQRSVLQAGVTCSSTVVRHLLHPVPIILELQRLCALLCTCFQSAHPVSKDRPKPMQLVQVQVLRTGPMLA